MQEDWRIRETRHHLTLARKRNKRRAPWFVRNRFTTHQQAIRLRTPLRSTGPVQTDGSEITGLTYIRYVAGLGVDYSEHAVIL